MYNIKNGGKYEKNITSISLSLLLCATIFGLVGCNENPPHQHNYVQTHTYVVQDNIAYLETKCSCGDIKNTELEAGSYIIANPTNAQSVLDGDINNKTIVFDSGNYSGLEIRPSASTAKIYNYIYNDWGNVDQENELATSADELDDTAHYTYKREIENVTLAGTKNAKFTGLVYFQSTLIYSGSSDIDKLNFSNYDAVRDVALTTDNSTVYNLYINGLSFKSMNFEGANARIYGYYSVVEAIAKNVVVENCSFKSEVDYSTNSEVVKRGAVVLQSNNTGNFENVVFKNNVINGNYQGLYTANVKNLTIQNNNISNTAHNAIGIYNQNSKYFTGNIYIANNIISEAKHISVKFTTAQDANIVFENNTIINTVKYSVSWPYMIQLGDMTNSSYSVVNNTYNGQTIKTYSANTGDYEWFYIYIPEYVEIAE